MVDPWLSCSHPGIQDPVRPSFIPASHPIYGGSLAFFPALHPMVDPWLSSYCSFVLIHFNHFSVDH
ncbi:hypothetical protein RHMOL_Rhmol11G0043300 [Rhododendron molle]|uniref:Uncharacterized protein n=1 Tax=Rhododendron molle TaxID=49168 RepID=A0ACC0LNZ6_RHOML|nr:hypothetical protein RHMOL_Rhmol11G0043300 [Rhododendron molle]